MKILFSILALIWIVALVLSLTSCSLAIDERGNITREIDREAVNSALEKVIQATK